MCCHDQQKGRLVGPDEVHSVQSFPADDDINTIIVPNIEWLLVHLGAIRSPFPVEDDDATGFDRIAVGVPELPRWTNVLNLHSQSLNKL